MSVPGVLVLLLCCWSLSLADDAAALSDDVRLADDHAVPNDDVATLLDRINTLESRIVRDQDHLKTRLFRQESLNQELTTRLARQGVMLLQQGRLIQQLRSAAASLASATVSLTSATFIHDDVKDATGSKTPALGSVSGHNVAQRSDSGLNVTKRRDTDHNIAKRSDDSGPLEAVVNQISQRVTEQGAELQALKTQTTADLNALKVQTTADVNALKVQTTADVQTLQNSDRQHDLTLQDARTSTFVCWGSSTYSNSYSLVYSGVVGGSWYELKGAATNYLCLTLSPVFSQQVHPNYFAALYGAEYRTGYSHQNKNAVCAVCRAAFSTTVMVPGTDTCSPGWHRHYIGYLMAGDKYQADGTEYICVDSALEKGDPHGDANDNAVQLAYTVTQCGYLPCGPYVNDKVVLCAVCSK